MGITDEPGEVEEILTKYLARNVVSNGSAIKLANGALREQQRVETVNKAIIDAAISIAEPHTLREILAKKVEEETGSHPTDEAIDRIMEAFHIAIVIDPLEQAKRPPPKPASCTFQVNGADPVNIPTKSQWTLLLANLCAYLIQHDRFDFSSTFLGIGTQFTSDGSEGFVKPISDSGWYVKFATREAAIATIPSLLKALRYPSTAVTIKSKDGTILYPDTPGANLAQ